MAGMVEYMGRMVPIAGFRAFVYGMDGKKKLVDSWKEFEAHVSTGLWFPTKEESKPKEEAIPSYDKRLKKGRD